MLDRSTLKNQRIRWQRGLGQSLSLNWALMFSRRGGLPGWFAFPFMVFFEWWGPVFEIAGYIFMLWAYAIGILNPEAMVAFLLVAVGMGVLLSTSSLLLEERSFHIYPKSGQTVTLLCVAIVENFGYRQLMVVFRLYGLLQSLFGAKSRWGRMRRRSLG
jgi:cellulose synthase/poly-beta-1,6-N-acetylglucosamine synthase-like glycosyltransferase